MVSDYFFPDKGGIETHILELSLALIERGHRVIGITHCRKKRFSVEYYKKFKIYYLNLPIFRDNTTFPCLITNLFPLADIFKHEDIQIVHGHQSMSSLALESLFHAQVLRLQTIFTDHSLFETDALENIVINRVVQFILKKTQRIISVSHTLKENLIDRLALQIDKIHVIPNAVSEIFKIRKIKPFNRRKIVIVSFCRFVYRKGIDLLIQSIPLIAKYNQSIKFVLIGDGPKRDEVEQMIDDHNLYDRIELIGFVEHRSLPRILAQCDIFLNTSLTESFCMAIVEAAALGLQVVSTNVGAVYEILPPSLITLVSINAEDIVAGVKIAIAKCESKLTLRQMDTEISEVYSWSHVSIETEKVYNEVMKEECVGSLHPKDFCVFGILLRFLAIMQLIIYRIWEFTKVYKKS